MSEAVFALAGALLGVLGTVLTEAFRTRSESAKARRESLRDTVATLLNHFAQARRLCYGMRRAPQDVQQRVRAEEVIAEARGAFETLRLISGSMDVQEAARHSHHYTHRLFRAAEGQRGGFDELAVLQNDWMLKLVVAARSELGTGDAQNVYDDPETGFFDPAAQPGRTSS